MARPIRIETIELIQGPRFFFREEEGMDMPSQIRGASSRSWVVEDLPISGPIFRLRQYGSWGGDPWVGYKYFAHCQGCDQQSKLYKRRNENAMYSWAHLHRCPPREYIRACSARTRQYWINRGETLAP